MNINSTVKNKIMSKPIIAIANSVGGVDLQTERDAGNSVRILTGRIDNSLDFWERLLRISTKVVKDLKEEQKFEDKLVNP